MSKIPVISLPPIPQNIEPEVKNYLEADGLYYRTADGIFKV